MDLVGVFLPLLSSHMKPVLTAVDESVGIVSLVVYTCSR